MKRESWIVLPTLLLGCSFLVQAQEPLNHGDDDQQDEDQQECLPDQGKEPGQCEPGQGKEPGQGQEPGQGLLGYRADCRYHSNPQVTGVRFCMASILYRLEEKVAVDFKMGVGCDYEVIFSGSAWVDSQTIADRVMPKGGILPGVDLPPGALRSPGTYQSILDVFAGQLSGTCYVKQITYGDLL